MSIRCSYEVPQFCELNELTSHRNDAKILFATDDWFGEAENLLKEESPIDKPNLYTEYGKWMDGWETRRKRCAGHDWCIIKLGAPGIIYGVDVDTSFFTGNFAPRFSVQAANLTEKEEAMIPMRSINPIGTACTKELHDKVKKLHTEKWTELIPMTQLRSGYVDTCHNYADVKSRKIWTHLRLNIYPDGGIARFRVFGEAKVSKDLDEYETVDLIAMKNGGVCMGYSNAHYGHPRNLIRPDNAESMADGWETARRLDRPPVLKTNELGILQVPGNEWAIFKLGHPGIISSIIVDTKHFKGNYPDSVQVEGTLVKVSNNGTLIQSDWKPVLRKTKLSPHFAHEFLKDELTVKGPFSHLRITIAPDGGISRFNAFGTPFKF